MTTTQQGGFEVLQGFPADVVAVSAHGRITAQDYETVLVPLVTRTAKAEGKVKLFYMLGSEFGGVTAGAAWDDAKLGLLHLGDFARIAVVTDIEWIRLGVKMFAPLLRCPVHLFALSEAETAKAWILDDHPAASPGPGYDADHTVPALEDRD